MKPTHLIDIGDKIRFVEERQAYEVRARNTRYLICTKPHNLAHTVLYTIIDLERNVRGTDNLLFSHGYDTDAAIRDNMKRLDKGVMEVSYRNCVPLNIKNIITKQGKKWL